MKRSSQDKRTLTIVCYNQFGYLTDTLEYCKALRDKYNIHYICIDHGMEKQCLEGVQVHYLETNKKGTKKWWEFLNFSIKSIPVETSILFVKYFLFCSVLSFKYRNISNVDIRTGSVKSKKIPRFIENLAISIESRFYKNRTIISESLSRKLRFPFSNILPLGSNIKVVSQKEYSFEQVRLLYVGTLSGRQIDKVIEGIDLFIKTNTTDNLVFDIVGDGYGNEVEELQSLVKDLKLENNVKIHGRIPYLETEVYFDNANIGVSFVPKTSFFDVQPVTKTFEYLGAGMPVIATSTTEQRKVVDRSEYGQLCEDNSKDFCEALKKCIENQHLYDFNVIRKRAEEWSWEAICLQLDVHLENIQANLRA